MSQYADLAKGMQATTIGDRTPLDQTLIYGIGELAELNTGGTRARPRSGPAFGFEAVRLE